MLNLPSSVPVALLNKEHPEYQLRKQSWIDGEIMYRGGDEFRNDAERFLHRKVKEVSDVYNSRLDHSDYTNLISAICSWYRAAAFNKPIEILASVAGSEDIQKAQDAVTPEQQAFLEYIQSDCDHAGTSLIQFMADQFEYLLVTGRRYILLDLPDAGTPDSYTSLQHQKDAGALNPLLIGYSPLDVPMWQTDDYGVLRWCVLKVVTFVANGPLEPLQRRTCWYIYDTKEVTAYESFADAESQRDNIDPKAIATLVQGYPRPHALSAQQRVPLTVVKFPDALWIGKRILEPAIKYFNLESSLDWQIWNSACATLWVFGEFNDKAEVSEVAYNIAPDATKAEFIEPAGKSMAIHKERLSDKREEIYRAAHLMDQARSNKATAAASSGLSKEMDKTPSRDMLQACMDALRPYIQGIIDDMLTIRDFADVEADVRMPSFADKEALEVMELMTEFRSLGIQSDTADKEAQKKIWNSAFDDANPALTQQVFTEIESAPTQTEIQAAQEAAAALGFEAIIQPNAGQ